MCIKIWQLRDNNNYLLFCTTWINNARNLILKCDKTSYLLGRKLQIRQRLNTLKLCLTTLIYWTDIHIGNTSMVQSPSWEANWFAASQEIPRISRNPKVHYRTQNRPTPVSILVQPNPVHIPTSHLLEIHPNIIHPSTPRSPHWPPSLRFPHQDPIHRPLLTHTRHMPSPSHSSRFYHPHNIGWGGNESTNAKFTFLKLFGIQDGLSIHMVQ